MYVGSFLNNFFLFVIIVSTSKSIKKSNSNCLVRGLLAYCHASLKKSMSGFWMCYVHKQKLLTLTMNLQWINGYENMRTCHQMLQLPV